MHTVNSILSCMHKSFLTAWPSHIAGPENRLAVFFRQGSVSQHTARRCPALADNGWPQQTPNRQISGQSAQKLISNGGKFMLSIYRTLPCPVCREVLL